MWTGAEGTAQTCLAARTHELGIRLAGVSEPTEPSERAASSASILPTW